MTQLVLDVSGNAIYLPESQKRGYRAWVEDGGVEVEMISRRTVRELRGSIWRVTYQYGWFDDADRARVLESCEKGRRTPIECLFLPPHGNELLSGSFFVTSITYPTFKWSRLVPGFGEDVSVPMWANFGVELREVRPHD